MGGQQSEKGVASGVVKGIVKIKVLAAAFTITAIFYSHNIHVNVKV
ncbi:MAG: hypothetical protein V3R86_00300 [Candidatus Hydrothermarchaeaceae archaeon]